MFDDTVQNQTWKSQERRKRRKRQGKKEEKEERFKFTKLPMFVTG